MADNRKTRRTAAKQKKSPNRRLSSEAIQLTIDRAVADAQADRFQDADRSLRRVLKTETENAEALHQLGMNLAREGRAQEGLEYLRRATKLKPEEALYWNNLAACCFSAGEVKEAATAAKHAVERDPTYTVGWDNLGTALMEMGDFSSAVQAFKRRMELKAPDLSTLKRAAKCYMNIREFPAAETCLRQAESLAPEDTEILSNLGAVLMGRGDVQEAVVLFARAADRTPDRYFVSFGYARALLASGERDKALRWLRRATSADHQALEAWVLLAQTLLDANQNEEASVAANRAQELAPRDPTVAHIMERLKSSPDGRAAMPGQSSNPTRRFELGGSAGPNGTKPEGGLDINFGTKKPGKLPALQSTPAVAKPDANGVLDLSILKIE